jgi:hypothetical protein
MTGLPSKDATSSTEATGGSILAPAATDPTPKAINKPVASAVHKSRRQP